MSGEKENLGIYEQSSEKLIFLSNSMDTFSCFSMKTVYLGIYEQSYREVDFFHQIVWTLFLFLHENSIPRNL